MTKVTGIGHRVIGSSAICNSCSADGSITHGSITLFKSEAFNNLYRTPIKKTPKGL